MKRLLIAALVLSSFGVNANQYCRVLTYVSGTTTSAKGVNNEHTGDMAKRVIMNDGRSIWIADIYPKATEVSGAAWVMQAQNDDNTILNYNDVNNSNSWGLDIPNRTFYEADVFIPDEGQADRGLNASSTVWKGTYKACTPSQQLSTSKAVDEVRNIFKLETEQ